MSSAALATAVTIALLAATLTVEVPSLTGEPGRGACPARMIEIPAPPHTCTAANKPFRTFAEFYPFYLSEHTDGINRALHVVGTAIILGIIAQYPQLVLALVGAGSAGAMACAAMQGAPHGAVEAVVALGGFLLLGKLLTRSLRIPLSIVVIGYSFAWVGHFFFEENKPASFIYPSFSLMGDFAMFFDVLSGKEGISFKQ